jgi:nicotinic acid mononucleotide adenylyltransferase
MINEQIYEELINGKRPYYKYEYPDHYRQLRKGTRVNLLPGSFNPLHKGHLAIWESIQGPKFFEISITRYGKDPYPIHILNEVLSQFHNKYSYIVTNVYDFLSKSSLLRHWDLVFHVGWDTASRINMMYSHAVLESMGTFQIYEREINREVYNLNALEDRPSNFVMGELKNNQFIGLSSSALRNN